MAASPGGAGWEGPGMQFLLRFHGEVRWLVATVGVAAIVRFAWGAFARVRFGGIDRALMAAFTGLLDLNVLLGLILLFGLPGGLFGYRVEHAATMLLAVVTAHLSAIWRRSDDDARKFRNYLLLVVVALILVVTAIVRLRGHWVFR
jgi:hypothetical protein